jgi:translocation and assembly module TamB
MSRPLRTAVKTIGAMAVCLAVLMALAIFVSRTAWFETYARSKVLSVIEDSTGGRAEMQSFVLHLTTLRAQATGLVVHGTEPAGDPPLFAVRSIIVELRLFGHGPFSRFLDLKSLRVDQPHVNVKVFPDGRTNIPTPKGSSSGGVEPKTVVDLLSHSIEIRDGVFQLLQQKLAFSIRGRDFRMSMAYNSGARRYDGEIAVNPLSLVSDERLPIDAHVTIPLALDSNHAQISNARIETRNSLCILNARLENLASPALTAGISAHLSLEDLKRGLNLAMYPGQGAPQFLDAAIGIRMDDKALQLQNSRLTLGRTYLEVSGNLQGPTGDGADVRGGVSLDEIAKLMRIPNDPRGVLNVSGKAGMKPLGGSADYVLAGNVRSSDISFQLGHSRVAGFRIDAPVRVEPKAIEVKGVKLVALGGEAILDARLEDFANLTLTGTLHGFETQSLASALLAKRSVYGASIGGTMEARGSLKSPAVGVRAQAALRLVPNGSGTPLSGQINLGYTSAAKILSLGSSFLELPYTRINLGGEIGPSRDTRVDIVTRNVSDLSPAIAMFSTIESPVMLKGGAGHITVSARSLLSEPQVAGNVSLTSLVIGQRSFDRLGADFKLSPSLASVENGAVAGKSVQARFSASLALHQWSPEPQDPVTVNATVVTADLADILTLAGQTQIPARGAASADVRISGTFGNPLGSAQFTALNGSLYDQPFDRLSAQADLSSGMVTLRSAHMTTDAAWLDAQGSFTHPQDDFETGQVQLHLNSNPISLSLIQPLQQQRPELAGTVTLNAALTGDVRKNAGRIEFVLSSVDGSLNAVGVRDKTGNYGNLTATAHTAGGEINTVVDSDLAGSRMHLTGRTRLGSDYATTADGSIQGLPLERVLAIVAPDEKNQHGLVSATAHVSGTLEDPQGRLSFELTKAVLFDEPVDRAAGAVDYNHDKVTIPEIQVSSSAGQIAMNGSIAHSGFDFANGRAEVHVSTRSLDLRRIQNVQRIKPGLAGVLTVTADAAADLQRQQGQFHVRPSRADFKGGLTGLQTNGHAMGNLTFQGETKGTMLSARLDSDIGKSAIHGTGRVNLTGDYQAEASLTFANVTYSGMRPFLSVDTSRSDFDASVEGQAHLTGPALRPDDLTGEVRLSRVELLNTRPSQATTAGRVVLQNQEPMVARLDHSLIRLSSAHLTGRSTDLSVTGSATFDQRRALDLAVRGSVDLKVANDVYPDLFSSGITTLDASIRGSFGSPAIQGKIDLKNASMSFADISNGLTNATGEILLNGNTATFRTFTAESGGGKVTITGSASYNNGQFLPSLRMTASHVRVRYSGASVKGSGVFTLSGTNERAGLAGNATIEQVAYNQQSDMGSILSQAFETTPREVLAAAAPEGLLANCHLNVGIKTAPDVRFRTTLAQDLAGTADLTLGGSLAQPGMTGRIDLTSGSMVFFGNTYTVNRGAITFYDASKIQPVIDLELQTTADSVQVVVGFSGPIDNLKMSYRSDPPLKFDEITALLTTGKTPDDATIAAHTPTAPSQTTAQMGESAVLGQAIANPAASRMQRVFGVTQLKVDPSFTSGGSLPGARVTLQQQVSGAITFTYTEDLQQANSEIIRVEWAFSPRWSAVATRDEYGIFGIDFVYKKQFR